MILLYDAMLARTWKKALRRRMEKLQKAAFPLQSTMFDAGTMGRPGQACNDCRNTPRVT